MKSHHFVTVFIFVLLFSNIAFGQFGNQNGFGGQGGYGNGRNGQSSMNLPDENRGPSAEETEKSKKERFDFIINKLKTEIELDELQVIAVSNIITASIKSQGILMKQEIDQAQKVKDLQALSETTDRKIMEMLNKTQKEKYLFLKDNPKSLDVKKKKTKK